MTTVIGDALNVHKYYRKFFKDLSKSCVKAWMQLDPFEALQASDDYFLSLICSDNVIPTTYCLDVEQHIKHYIIPMFRSTNSQYPNYNVEVLEG